ncbi:MAG: hypothetical protein V7711_18175 [Pseudomonadales bacterium]
MNLFNLPLLGLVFFISSSHTFAQAIGNIVYQNVEDTVNTIDQDGAVLVSWAEQATAVSYQIAYRLNGGNWKSKYTSSAEYQYYTLLDGSYDFRVRWIDELDAKSAWGYAAPSLTVVAGIGLIQYSGIEDPLSNTDTDGHFAVDWNAATGVAEYKLQSRIDGGSWGRSVKTSSPSISYLGLTDGVYEYRIRYLYAAGGKSAWSAPSNTVTVTAGLGDITLSELEDVPNRGDTDGAFSVQWPAIAGAVSYKLQTSKDTGSWGSTKNTTSNSFSYFGMPDGTYQFRVQAIDASELRSAWSNASPTLTETAAIGLLNFSGLEDTPAGIDNDGTFTVNWNVIAQASSYQLARKLNDGSWIKARFSANTHLMFTGLEPGQHTFKLRAKNSTKQKSQWGTEHYISVVPAVAVPVTTHATRQFNYDAGGHLIDDTTTNDL